MQVKALRIRLQIIILLIILISPLTIFSIYNSYQDRSIKQEIIKNDLFRIAKIVAVSQETYIQSTNQLLITLAQLPQLTKEDLKDCSPLLSTLLKNYQHYSNIGVLDKNGDLICSALPYHETVNYADRYFFQKALTNREFTVGEYIIGRVSNKATINFGYPILDSNNKVSRVVFNSLDLDWLNKLTSQLGLDEGIQMVLIDRKSRILAHYPNSEQWVGKTLQDLSLSRTILQGGEGVTDFRGIGDIERIYAFTPLQGAEENVYLALSVPKQSVLDQLNKDLYASFGWIIGLSLISLVTGIILSEIFLFPYIKSN